MIMLWEFWRWLWAHALGMISGRAVIVRVSPLRSRTYSFNVTPRGKTRYIICTHSVRRTLVPDISGTSLWSDYMSREAYMYERSVGVKWQSHGNSLHYYTVLDIAAFGKVQGAVSWHWSLLSTPTNECLIHCCLGYSFILFIFYLLFLYLLLFAWVGNILNTCKGPYTWVHELSLNKCLGTFAGFTRTYTIMILCNSEHIRRGAAGGRPAQ